MFRLKNCTKEDQTELDGKLGGHRLTPWTTGLLYI